MRRCTALVAALVWLVTIAVAGQTRPSSLPHTPDGHPDLQGIYDLATLTPLERRAGTPLVLTDEQAAKLETDVATRWPPRSRPTARRRPRAATDRRDRTETSAATTISGSIPDRITR